MRLRNNPNALTKCNASRYFKSLDELKDFKFKNNNAICLEVGSGKGGFLWNQARLHPEINYVGLEKFITVIGKAIYRYESSEQKLDNIILSFGDAEKLLDIFPPKSFDIIYLNFSDPWPKKRHAKRRLVDIRFLKLYDQLLKPNGWIEFKTDNDGLFEYYLEQIELMQNVNVINQTSDLYSLNLDNELIAKNIATEYEKKFVSQGIKIKKIVFNFKN